MSDKYEKWQALSNAYRKTPNEKTKKAAYDAFDSYREEGIKEANKLTPEQASAKKAYLAEVAAENAGVQLNENKTNAAGDTYKKGGKVKKMAKGGSAHSRADGIAQKGHTRGKYC